MSGIRSVYIGNFSLVKNKQVFGLKNYAQFYNELAEDFANKVAVFAGYYLSEDAGFEFSYEQQLNEKIDFTLSRGNSPATRLIPFLKNNFSLFCKLITFCIKKGNYFVFLPSPIGICGILIISIFNRRSSLGIYIGGYYGKEQLHEKRKGNIKKRIKKTAAILVDKLVLYAIKKADYVITSSYEYHHRFNSTRKVFLTPPMINVTEKDLELTFEKNECYITFCGELRHAKGILDLYKAFLLLHDGRRIKDCKLKIIGSGQAYDELVHLAAKDGISHLVIFCGQIKDQDTLKKELGNSTVFVLPSYSEGFPRVAYECFTLGIPTILTPVGGIPFFVQHREHCLLVQPGNVDEIATNITLLLNDTQLQSKLSYNARQLMAESIFPRIKSDQSLAKMIKQKITSLNQQ